MITEPLSNKFTSSLSYFQGKIDCVRCIPQNKNSSNFHLCSDCLSYFASKGIVGVNDEFQYILFTNYGQVIKAKILGTKGISYNPYLAKLKDTMFYDLKRSNRKFEDFIREMVQIDYKNHHLLVDFQDNSDEPLF